MLIFTCFFNLCNHNVYTGAIFALAMAKSAPLCSAARVSCMTGSFELWLEQVMVF